MKTVLYIAMLCFCGSACQAQVPANSKQPELLEHWRKATVSLGQVLDLAGIQHYVTIGSAVIVATDAHHACILTARHVVYNPENGYFPSVLYLRFPKETPGVDTDLGIAVPLTVNGRNIWQSPADGSDLAVIPLPDLSGRKDVHAVGIQDFGRDGDIFQGATVIVLGYPAILGPDFQTTPIARGGIIAWTDPDNRLGQPFLIDANVFNGNSGGPVFRVRNGFDQYGNMNIGGGLSFIGIVSKDAIEEAPVHVGTQSIGQLDPKTHQPIPFEAKVQNIGGIGIVEPASKARMLVEQFLGVSPPAAPEHK
ncbi:MAG: trypsin-like serine peptidase [Acidobacteriaceae bacterium]